MRRRILYVQYTNPAAYPPLEHSSRILADTGWKAVFLGTGGYGANSLCFPPHPRVQAYRMSFCPPGIRQKLHYLRYCLWVIGWTLRWRPGWIYVSTPLDAPLAWILMRFLRRRVIYHEHDTPSAASPSLFAFFRRRLLRSAVCIWPNRQRVEISARECPNPIVVWNCPARQSASVPRNPATKGSLEVFFHGSITPTRMPVTVLQALTTLPEDVRLTVAGYDPQGGSQIKRLREEASRLGVEHRFRYLGEIPLRDDLLAQCRNADVGLAFMPLVATDINESNMTGASNKPFDYLASGLALLVSDRPDWRAMFADVDMGLSCDPGDPASIATALRWFLEHPDEMRAMGERGRQRILADWNYETQFQPVLEILTA